MKLVKPSEKYQNSYINYIAELGSEERYPFTLDFEYLDFQKLLLKLNDISQGINLADGYVASSTFWLIDDSVIVGMTNIRHYLNDEIKRCGGHIGLSIHTGFREKGLGSLLMKLSIQKLIEKGIRRIHVHCHKHNHASAKMIIANGGVLDSEIIEKDEVVQRYIVE